MSAYEPTEEQATWARTDLLAPGTLTRPDHISLADWQRMGWHAKWKATRADIKGRPRPSKPTPDSGPTDADLIRCICGSWAFAGDVCMICARAQRRPKPPRQYGPCGTHAAFHRHLSLGETPCEPCVVAEKTYHAAAARRFRERKAAS